MKLRLRATDKLKFDQAFQAALEAVGVSDFPETWEAKGNFNTVATTVSNEEVDGEQIEIEKKQRVNVDWYNCHPKARDEQGEFIVTETDAEGNPTAYELAEGYHVEVASNVKLDFSSLIVTPENPQYKWA